MWNYGEIDKYITLEHMALLMKWFAEVDTKTSKALMISSIDRNESEYTVHLTDAGAGYSHKFKIEGDQVTHLGADGFWMS